MTPDSWESYFRVLTLVLDVSYGGRDTSQYSKLLWKLFNTEFVAKVKMDKNRIEDAMAQRRFFLFDELTKPVGILEVMLSLARRLETDIMHGTAPEDRTAIWFWDMIDSLGLTGMTDDVYDDVTVSRILLRLVRRKYSRNGRGGLFTINDPSTDMRKEEIWYQAALYLIDILKTEGFIEP